jgi:hypothetical protein
MKTHTITVGSERRELPIVNVGAVSVALLNLLGDTKLTEAAANELVKQMPKGIDTFVTPECTHRHSLCSRPQDRKALHGGCSQARGAIHYNWQATTFGD